MRCWCICVGIVSARLLVSPFCSVEPYWPSISPQQHNVNSESCQWSRTTYMYWKQLLVPCLLTPHKWRCCPCWLPLWHPYTLSLIACWTAHQLLVQTADYCALLICQSLYCCLLRYRVIWHRCTAMSWHLVVVLISSRQSSATSSRYTSYTCE